MAQTRKWLFLSGTLLLLSSPLYIQTNSAKDSAMALTLTSPKFPHNAPIPAIYTCDGQKDLSPPLTWSAPPQGTQSLVLIVDDPDAPHKTWDHWILFNLPASLNALDEGAKELPPGARSGKNSWGQLGYGGPCPPTGQHRYIFKLYALDTRLDLPEGCSKADIEVAMKEHVLEETQLVGVYERKKV